MPKFMPDASLHVPCHKTRPRGREMAVKRDLKVSLFSRYIINVFPSVCVLFITILDILANIVLFVKVFA